ncbi:MAG: tetratricopeptide repeat protein [Flavobacteriales bacterium]
MFKKISKFSLLLVISVFTSLNSVNGQDTTRSDNMTAFTWEVISGVEKLDVTKDMSKTKIKKLAEGNNLYSKGIVMMKNKNYSGAIEQFKLAMGSYKGPLKNNQHYYNYININQALCYAKEKDFAVAKRCISKVSSKIEKEKEWLYNLAIANNMVGDHQAAISNLTKAIRLDENYFQAYITLEKIHRDDLKNTSNADNVRNKMETVEARLIKKEHKNKINGKRNKDDKSKGKEVSFGEKEGEPNITTLNIVKNDDPLQFNKISQIKEKSMTLVQDGVDDYYNGVDNLAKGSYTNAIENLKNTERKLKKGKIINHGCNFYRGQLAIAYLCTKETSKLPQVKKNLKKITNRLYDSRDWTYNMAVVNYEYATKKLIRYEKDNSKWKEKAKQSKELKNSIKLFKLTIRHDKFYLTPYKNLYYIYKELGNENQSEKYQKLYHKRRNELLNSLNATTDAFDREGVIFRIHLGTFGEYEAPADVFDEDYIITVPINEQQTQTAYLVGKFEEFKEAKEYLNKIIDKEYTPVKLNKKGFDMNAEYPKIITYLNGDEMDF